MITAIKGSIFVFSKRNLTFCVALGLSFLSIASGEPKRRGDLTRFVAVGDSLTAGVQNIGLEGSQQANGFAALIARQAGIPFVQPLVEFPGSPAYLTIYQNGPFPVTGPVAAPRMVGRLNPTAHPDNLAVPSFTVANALEYRPNASAPYNPGDRGPLVLGIPGPFVSPGMAACATNPMPDCVGSTMIELAKARKPTTTLVWIGNNDALIAGLFGDLRLLTPLEKFEADFSKLMDELESTGTDLIVGTIPDITAIPYFSSARDIASRYHLSRGELASKLNLAEGDYVRLSALPVIDAIVRGTTEGPLPAVCAPPIYVLPQVPCRLTAADAEVMQDRIKDFNKVIAKQTRTRSGVLVDTNKLVDQIAKRGYVVGNEKLTTNYLGGLFSLDGIHPSNTGYAVIANSFIREMNVRFRLQIPEVSVEKVWASDPLRPFTRVESVGK